MRKIRLGLYNLIDLMGGGRKGERGREKERERENHSLKMTSKLRNFSSGFLTPAKARRRQSSNSDQSGGKQET